MRNGRKLLSLFAAASAAGGASPGHLAFGGDGDNIVVPASATLNDLPVGDFTIDLAGVLSDVGDIAHKYDNVAVGGWKVVVNPAFYFEIGWDQYAKFGSADADFTPGATLRHIEIVWVTNPRAVHFFVDGVALSLLSSSFDVGGVYTTDAGTSLKIFASSSNAGEAITGNLRWFRISDIARHTSGFTAPSLSEAPADDADTVLLYDFTQADPSGTATDLSGNGNDGTINGGTWVAG